MSDIHDERTHPCGCRTYFDVALWRSRTATACDEHASLPAVTHPHGPTRQGPKENEQ